MVRTATELEWATSVPSLSTRQGRLGVICPFASLMRAEDPRHEVPCVLSAGVRDGWQGAGLGSTRAAYVQPRGSVGYASSAASSDILELRRCSCAPRYLWCFQESGRRLVAAAGLPA